MNGCFPNARPRVAARTLWITATVLLASTLPMGCERRATDRANVLLITIDTLRADHLSCYGYSRVTSPAIDALASHSVQFANAFATVSYTVPSHASLFTSAYPSFHGIGTQNQGAKLDPDQPTLASLFAQAGYETAAFVSNPLLRHDTGLQHGFGFYGSDKLVDPATGTPRERVAGNTLKDVEEWLQGEHARPFFLWVHLFDPHASYIPPARLKGRFHSPPTGVSLPVGTSHFDGYRNILPYARLGEESDPAYYMDRYDEEILYADEAVGALLHDLVVRQLQQRTIVVLTSDHGEAFGEHDYYFCHGLTLAMEQIHVPLLFAGVDLPARKVEHVVSLIDVMPTLLELTGLSVPDELAGESLVPLLYGTGSLRSRRIFAESGNQEAVVQFPFLYYRDRKDVASLPRSLGAHWKVLPTITPPEAAGEPPIAELERSLDELVKLRGKSTRRAHQGPVSEALRNELRQLGYPAPPQ